MIIAFSATLENITMPHAHRVNELIVCVKGSAALDVNGRKYSIDDSHSVLVPAGIAHHYESSGTESADVVIICFESKSLESRFFASARSAGYARILSNEATSAALDKDSAEENINLAGILKRTLGTDRPYSREKAESILDAILLNHLISVQSSVTETDHSRIDDCQAILRWIDDHLLEDISIEAAAREVHMSRSVFTRYFKRYTNLTFSNYVIRARLKRSADLLLGKRISIEDVAYLSGYKNIGHFYAQFQRHFGITPKQYRNVAIEQRDL